MSVSSLCMMLPQGSFTNRGYPAYRKDYNQKVSVEAHGQKRFGPSPLARLNTMADEHFESFCNKVGRGKLRLFETKHGEQPQEIEGYARAPFMGVSHVPQMRTKPPEG